MRLLLPRYAEDVDAAEVVAGEERTPRDGRPWLVLNMISTADGAIAVGGVSGPIGGPGDKVVFRSLRAAADVVLVAAGTARAEDYGPARTRPDGTPGPRIAVVTRSGDLDPAARLFSGGRPLVVTCSACPEDRRRALSAVADVLVVGDREVDLPAALDELGRSGARVVLCEGGPTLNGQLLADDLVDEWCLTLSPLLAGGRAGRAAAGAAPPTPVGLRLDRALVDDDGLLLLRYLRR